MHVRHVVLALAGFLFAGIGVSAMARPPAFQLTPGMSSETVGGRNYDIYVPNNHSGRLIVALTGGYQSIETLFDMASLQDMADQHGFIIAMPVANDGQWNVGDGGTSNSKDLKFIESLIDEVESSRAITETFAVGISRGGMMAYWAACNLPGRFTAISALAATLAADTCPDATTPLLHIHGSNDESVPIEGGAGQYSTAGSDWNPVMPGVQLFAAVQQCPLTIVTQIETDTKSTTCASGNVEFVLVTPGGHAWPGADPTPRQIRRGIYVSPYFDATEYIAQFFLSR